MKTTTLLFLGAAGLGAYWLYRRAGEVKMLNPPETATELPQPAPPAPQQSPMGTIVSTVEDLYHQIFPGGIKL